MTSVVVRMTRCISSLFVLSSCALERGSTYLIWLLVDACPSHAEYNLWRISMRFCFN
uniref:Uncharacterized protein n=1 Tax=Rhizophora mucronata TaxID=61149 RepID=A0A2P2N7I4_RHIMU